MSIQCLSFLKKSSVKSRLMSAEETKRAPSQRHRARIAVLQIAYANFINDNCNLESLGDEIFKSLGISSKSKDFFEKLLKSTLENSQTADKLIADVCSNWDIDRVSIVDRCIIRMGVAELIAFPDISPRVTIDEAIELAKEFGGNDSPRFVNGILDAVFRRMKQLGMTDKQ